MKTISTVTFFAAFIYATVVSGQVEQCLGIIAHSRVVNSQFSDEQEFEQRASNFCDEYSRTRTDTSSRSYGASYKYLSASVGASNASYEDLASRFCSAENSAQARRDVFRNYAETISPQAYEAYDSCVAAVSRGNGPVVIPFIDPEKKTVNYSMTDDRAVPASLQGVYSPIFGCTDHAGRKIGQGNDYAEQQLSERALNLTCRRHGIECRAGAADSACPVEFPAGSRAYTHYPGGVLTLNLSSGQHNMSFSSFNDGDAMEQFEEIRRRISNLETGVSNVDRQVTVVNERFGKLELRVERKDNSCNVTTPVCPEGWLETDAVFHNTFPGRGCGEGSIYRLCIRAGE